MKVKRLAKVVNKRTLKFLSLLAAVVAVATAVVSAMGTLLVFKQLRLVDEQRRTLAVLKRAAELYLQQNESEEDTPSKSPRLGEAGPGAGVS